MCLILERNVDRERWQGRLRVPVWVPVGLCVLRSRPLIAGESQESTVRYRGVVDLGSDPNYPDWKFCQRVLDRIDMKFTEVPGLQGARQAGC